MQVKILKDSKYSKCGKHIEVSKGDVCDLPEFVANFWLKSGLCEVPSAKKSPVQENKSINPVEENKEVAPKKKTSKKKAK